MLKNPHMHLFPPASGEGNVYFSILLMDQNSAPKVLQTVRVTHRKGMSSYITGDSTDGDMDEGSGWGWPGPLRPTQDSDIEQIIRK